MKNAAIKLCCLAGLALAVAACGKTGRIDLRSVDPSASQPSTLSSFKDEIGGSVQLVEAGKTKATGISASVSLAPIQQTTVSGGGLTIEVGTVKGEITQ